MMLLHSYKDDELHFHAIEKHVRKVKPSDAQSFNSLIKYFDIKLDKKDPNYDILLVRAILVWICQLKESDLTTNPDTPCGLIKKLRAEKIDYSKVFKILCGYANIECEIITGRAKAIRYRAGDTDSAYIQGHTWNAFKAGDTWHLVHPQWCIQSYVGFQHGGEYRLVNDGAQNIEHLHGKEGVPLWRMNEFWFCTNPEIFVQRCFPDDPKWQCLPKEKRIGSVAKFMALPDLKQGFYSNYLTLLSEHSCSIEAKLGKCSVSFLAQENRGAELEFRYELLADTVGKIDDKANPLLVLYIPNQRDVFTFEVSLPAPGNYRLKIYSNGKGKSKFINCFEVKIVCKKAVPVCKKLPVDAGIQGWGFSQDAKDAGLKKPSTSGARIEVKEGGQQTGEVIYSAKVDPDEAKDRNFLAYLYSSDDADRIDQAIVTMDNRKMQVKVPNNKPLQNSALVLKTKNKHGHKSSEQPLAYYLLAGSEACDEEKDKTKLNQERKKKIRRQQKLTEKLKKKALLERKRDKRKLKITSITR